jgi:hypothetical protein
MKSMPSKVLDIRFGVKRPDGYESSVWKVWANKTGDAYVSMRSMTGIQKFSSHASGICRHAFTKEYGTPVSLSDRATLKWTRTLTPAAGSGEAAMPALLFIPTDYLSKPIPHKGQIDWVEAAPPGMGTVVEFLYTSDDETVIEAAFAARGERHILAYARLNPAEAFFVVWHHTTYEGKGFRMTGRGVNDIIISEDDPHETGRPIRVVIGPRLDNRTVLLEDYGGYAVPALNP